MRLVGLTGGIASGKSTVTKYLVKQGFTVIDCDKITASLYKYNKSFTQGVFELFGERVLTNGKVDKKKVSSIVFNSESELAKLNSFAFDFVFEEVKRQIQCNSDLEVLFIDAPILFESGLYEMLPFTDIWVISVSKSTQMWRMKRRNSSLTDVEILSRINSQWPDEEKCKCASYVIRNKKSVAELYKKVDRGIAMLFM